MEISGRYGFHAPSEVVFNNLTDPDRVHRWLPIGLHVERRSAERILLIAPVGSTECEIDTAVDDKRLTLRSIDAPGVHGTATVEDDPAGGSRVHVVVSAEGVDLDPESVRDVLAETMSALCSDVDENFNTG
ncbi:SRPBCC family protein [Phytohabitans kaempferiae]|uniref:SRPBCC family protein n=1 Tax=Phytohabitans kaempferiae TaxID=1620943 RepID=A0ABV6M966_9ACTN